MTTHTLQTDTKTLHGYFSKDLPPVLHIQPGDTVHYVPFSAFGI